MDYSVTSLREDLRSGIRLAKLYEVLTGTSMFSIHWRAVFYVTVWLPLSLFQCKIKVICAAGQGLTA